MMRILRFEAATVQEALQQVRSELGPDAVILYTKKLRKGGLFGFMGNEVAEITAGLDDQPRSAPTRIATLERQETAPRRRFLSPVTTSSTYGGGASLSNVTAPKIYPSTQEKPISVKKQDIFQSELNDGKVLAGYSSIRPATSKKTSDLHPELQRFQATLEKNGVEPEVAAQLLKSVNKEITDKGYPRAGSLGHLLEKFIAASVKVSGPIESLPGRPRVIALIGPTGVGKTTNLVKLASQYSLLNQLKVALLTADTYRIGAVEQLRIYRDIIDIPFEAVSSPEDLKEALKRHADRDLIFFDTAGRSPQNKKQLQELRAFLEAAAPSEVHLVISATTKNTDLLPIVGKFGLVPINRFLITKLDETRSHGLILNLASNFSIPISYLSNGQNVPNDIEVATPERLAELVLGETRG
jgi:flagellar biosynthesis protein FlhF